jgi:hypothetical protein
MEGYCKMRWDITPPAGMEETFVPFDDPLNDVWYRPGIRELVVERRFKVIIGEDVYYYGPNETHGQICEIVYEELKRRGKIT